MRTHAPGGAVGWVWVWVEVCVGGWTGAGVPASSAFPDSPSLPGLLRPPCTVWQACSQPPLLASVTDTKSFGLLDLVAHTGSRLLIHRVSLRCL